MITAPSSPAELLDLVRKSGIVPPDRLAGLPDPAALPADPQQAAAVLVGRGLLTRFQAQQLLQGKCKGFRVGPYTVRDLIGRGGMGAVYLAEHADLRRKVALKVLLAGKTDNQKLAQERFLREARAAAALDHPNIVRIFDVSNIGGLPYLVMEYVEGDTLEHLVKRDGAIPYPDAVDYIAQAAAGLQHAHEQGLVHRDIKPANLIRDRSGTVKILDMGLARSAADPGDNLTERLDSGAIVGTADYIAPEQALSGAKIDGRADVYSLGATFFAVVTGKPPFNGNTAQKLLHHQMKAPPSLSAFDPTLPKGLAAVVARMMAKKPDQRYQTAAEVIAALVPWLGNTSRVLAGLTKTNLGQTTGVQAALHGLAGRSSRRIVPIDPDDSASVDPSRPTKDTGDVASAETTREPIRPGPAAPAPAAKPDRKKLLIAAGVAALLAIGGVVAAASGGKKPAHATEPQEAAPSPPAVAEAPKPPAPEPAPVTRPNPQPPAPPTAPVVEPPPVVAPPERELYRLDLTGQEPFLIRSGLTVPNPSRPNTKVYNLLTKTGSNPPAGWSARCWNVDTQMEFFAEDRGGMCLGMRNVRGPGSAMILMPRFECPSGTCRLTFEYQAAVRSQKFVVRFKPDAAGAWDAVKPLVGGSGWRTAERVVDLRGATAGFFEFHNNDDSPDVVVRLRSVRVTEVARDPAAARTPTLPPAPAAAPEPQGTVVYRLEVDKIPPFRMVRDGGKRVGDTERLPRGVACYCWKPESVGEFRCEPVDGVPALGVTNLNERMSGQFAFELERELGLDLRPGRTYQVRVGYMTRNEAHGVCVVQAREGFKAQASMKLTDSGGGWKTATASFVRQDGVPVRLVIDNTSVGEGNTLFIRSVELVELAAPGN